MGYYIEVPKNKKKAEQIRDLYGGVILDKDNDPLVEFPNYNSIPKDKALVVVVDNGYFEAAGVVYNQTEFEEFTSANDWRPRRYVLIDKSKAIELAKIPDGVMK